jgi:hypothetical protein
LGMKWTTAGFQNYYFIRQFSNGWILQAP